ncbi:MAG: phosphoribosyl-AMP cyclohydrolase, partial [Gemmatimonadaceae bacterium]
MPDFGVDAVNLAKGDGLVPVVAQDAATGAVLMVAWADREALERSLETGLMHYHSRRRGLWQKGESSGHVQRIVSLALDCDGDTVLARVHQEGPACHTGATTCFGDTKPRPIDRLNQIVAARAATDTPDDPASYTHRLLADRNLRLKK